MGTGSKLVVRVLNAKNLMAKDGQGSSSAFVQVVFDGQRKSTRSISRDLNPVWDETFEFPISDFTDMLNEILEIDVIDNSRRPAGKKGKFLGRVCLHGTTFAKKGEAQLQYYRLDKRGLFSLVRGEIGLLIYYTDEKDGSRALNDESRESPHTQSTRVNAEREASSAQSTGTNAERESSGVQRVARKQERGAPKAERGVSIAQKVPANAERGSLSAERGGSRIVADAEGGAVNEERGAHKNTGLKRKSAPASEAKGENAAHVTKSEHIPESAIKSANASSIQPNPLPSPMESNGQPLHPLPFSGPPPSRRPPTVRFSLPPPASIASGADKSSGRIPSPRSLPTKTHEQNHENSALSDKPPSAALPNLEPRLAETQKTPLPKPDETLPDVVEGQEAAAKTPTTQLMPEEWSTTSLEEVEIPPTLAKSQEETSISLSPSDISSPIEGAAVTQPTVEGFEKMRTMQEKMELDMKPTIARTGEGVTNMEVLSNVEVVQPADSIEADYEVEDTTPAVGSEGAGDSDLVEGIHYLFVRVVKARSLIAKEVLVNPHPYAYVVLGNQHAKTKVIPNTSHPEWNQVFAFASHINAGILEVSLWDHNPPPLQDAFLGSVYFDLSEIPTHMSPDSPLAPQWYCLERKQDAVGPVSGDIMLCVWTGTQHDEAFSEAWHSDTGGYHASTRSKIYLSPKLWYLRLNVIEAQDLQTLDTPRRLPEASVKVQLGFQTARTRVSKRRSVSPFWNEELMLVATEPFHESVLLFVEDHQGPDKHEIIGTAQIPLEEVEKRIDDRQVASRWLDLQYSLDMSDATCSFQGRMHVRVCLEGGYHVMDEAAHLSSDTRPSAKPLWNAPIGVLELGILGAQNILPMKNKDGHGTTDSYCVAKYGPKWVRTRTILDSLSPRWNEQYTWEVYDPCTVLTLCVFDNGDLEHPQHQQRNTKHSRIGKVRVRLSMLEVERAYTISYPLMVLQPGGLKKMGDMEVALRFSCMSMFSLIHTYTKPLLPRMHYLYPLTAQQQEILRTAAMKLVALRLSRCEPPLKPEVVQFMLDADSALWSMRRSKAHWYRISNMLGGIYAIITWMKDIRQWRNPVTTLLVHVLFIILLCYPELILPTIFFYMFLIGLWQFRSRARSPPHIDPRLSQADIVDRDDLDEEFDTQPTSKPAPIVKLRYERLRGIAGRIQMVLGDIATQGERVHGLLTWRDPHATSIFVIFCFFTAVWLYVAPFKLVAFLLGLHFLRHPRFRDPLPSTLLNFFQRLPAQSDRIL